MDVLSDVLASLRLQSSVYCQSELTAPWGIEVRMPIERSNFLTVTRGSCLLEVDGEKRVSLAGGDLVLLPRSTTYVLRDADGSPVVPVTELFENERCRTSDSGVRRLQFGGGGLTTDLIIGCFEFEENALKNPLIAALPEMIHVRAETGQSTAWLDATLKFVAFETAAEAPGAGIALARLTDVLFIQAVRAYLAGCADKRGDKDCQTGWLRAVVDRQIGRSLAAIHERTGEPWTVASLAAAAGMSRSAFAARFNNLVGKPPLEYLTEWRMFRAARLLREEKRTLAEVSSSLGYESEAAFAKAFKRQTGVAPGSIRRAQAAATPRRQ